MNMSLQLLPTYLVLSHEHEINACSTRSMDKRVSITLFTMYGHKSKVSDQTLKSVFVSLQGTTELCIGGANKRSSLVQWRVEVSGHQKHVSSGYVAHGLTKTCPQFCTGASQVCLVACGVPCKLVDTENVMNAMKHETQVDQSSRDDRIVCDFIGGDDCSSDH